MERSREREGGEDSVREGRGMLEHLLPHINIA